MSKNVVEFGFNVEALNSEKQQVLGIFKDMFEEIRKYDGAKFTPINGGGLMDFKASMEQTKSIMDKMTVSSTKLAEAQTKSAAATREEEAAKRSKIQTDNEALKQMTLEEKQIQQEIKTREAQRREIRSMTKEKQDAAKAAQMEQKLAEELSNDYLQLSKAYNDAALKAKNYALTLGEENEVTKQAVKNAQEMYAILYRVDAAVGQHTRNVGNYKSAFDGLGNSAGQIARELPSLAINFQTFALAISNNLPIFFDEIGKARAEITALQAAGQQTPTLIQQIGSSFLSWNVALSIAIALFTVFAKDIGEFVTGIFDADAANKKLIESQKLLNEQLIESFELYDRLYQSRKKDMELDVQRAKDKAKLDEAAGRSAQDLLKTELEINKQRYLAATGGLEGDRAEALMQSTRSLNAQLVNEMEAYTDIIDELGKKLAEEKDEDRQADLKKEKEMYQQKFKFAQLNYDENNRVISEYYQSLQAFRESEVKLEAKKAEDVRTITRDFIKQDAELRIDANQRIIDNETSTMDQTIKALKRNQEERRRIIAADLAYITSDPKNKNQDGTFTAEARSAMNKANADRIKLERDTNKAIFDVKEEYRKRDLTADINLKEQMAKSQIEFNQTLLDNETASLKERLRITERNTNLLLFIEENRYRQELDKKGLTAKEKLVIESEHYAKLAEIRTQGQIELGKITDDFYKKELEAVERKVATEQKLGTAEQTSLLKEQTSAYADLVQKLREGAISLTEFNAEKTKLDDKFAIKGIEAQIDALLKIRKIRRENGQSTIELDNQIAALEKQLGERSVAETIQNEKLKEQAKLKTFEKEKELAFATLALIQTLATAGFENEKNRIQQIIDLNNERYSREIENIQRSSLADADKAAKALVLEKELDATNRRLQADQRELNIRKAKADRLFQAGQIIGNTALAVVGALAPPPIGLGPLLGLPLATTVGALGAVQLATLLASPIPQYAEGTDNHPGGLMIVGERRDKVPELVEMGGKAFIADKPTLMYGEAGAKVTPLLDNSVNDLINSYMTAGNLISGSSDEWAKWEWLAKAIISAQSSKPKIKNVNHNHINIDLGHETYKNKVING